MLEALKERVCEANLELKRSGLVILTWGNASARDAETGHIVIKPSGVGYDRMKPEHMVVVGRDGKVVEGDLRPSSDTPTHLVLYRAFPAVGGIVHTHSTHATAWAQARRALPCYGTTHADSFYGEVPVTAELTRDQVDRAYETETGEAIVKAFSKRDPLAMPGVLVAGHAPFTWGSDVEHAVENSIVLEEIARMAWITEQVNPQARPVAQHLLDKHYLRKHGPGAYYGQSGTK